MPLNPSKKNDQVFQLSLTELAFMLIFLLMLITGWMVLDADKKAREATAKLKQAEHALKMATEARQAGQQAEKVSKAAQALIDAMQKIAYQPDEVLADLRKCSVLEPENSSLKTRIADLEKQAGELTAFLQAMQALAGKKIPQAIADEFATAMAFKKGFEEASGKPLAGMSATKQG